MANAWHIPAQGAALPEIRHCSATGCAVFKMRQYRHRMRSGGDVRGLLIPFVRGEVPLAACIRFSMQNLCYLSRISLENSYLCPEKSLTND